MEAFIVLVGFSEEKTVIFGVYSSELLAKSEAEKSVSENTDIRDRYSYAFVHRVIMDKTEYSKQVNDYCSEEEIKRALESDDNLYNNI